MIVTLLLAFFAGILLYAGVPVALAHAYPIRIRKAIGDVYFWLAMHSYRRLNVLRKSLSGYSLHPFSLDESKHTGTYTTDEERHIDDPLSTLGRIYGKPIVVQYEESPTAVSPKIAELGAAWHEHCKQDDDVEDQVVGKDENGNPITQTRVNMTFPVEKATKIVDPKSAFHLMPGDTDPDDAAKAEAYTEKSQEGFRSNVGAVETISLLVGFVGSLGTVVGIQKYILDSASSGGGGGGSEVPSAPINMTSQIVPLDAAPVHAIDATMQFLGHLPMMLP